MMARSSDMDSFIQRLRSCILKEEDEGMELLLFRLLCIAAVLLSFFVVIPADYLHHLSPWINLVVLLFGLSALYLARESCRGRYHTKSLFFLLLIVLNLVWFPNGGSHGSIGYYFFILFVYVPIFFRGKARWLLLSIAITSKALLLAAELYVPNWVIPYVAPYHRTADLVVGFAVTALCCSLMLWVLLQRFDRKQQRLITLNVELQRSVAELVQAEDSLSQNQRLLDAVIQGSTDAIYVKDTQGRYVLVNGAAEQALNKRAAEVLGKDDTCLFPRYEAQQLMQKDQEVLKTKETQVNEFLLTHASGRKMLRETTKGPVHDREGNVIGIFGISRDITESRRIAEELHRLNEELERRVVERTARLEAAMREQESFSYSVSHDLRGPLRHINSYTAIIQEDFGSELPPDAMQYMERIRNSSRTMGDLIDDLLELSRVGRSELVKVPVNLSEIAPTIIAKLREADTERRIEFVIEPGLQVCGDRVLLGQMLENLLGNAWKYSTPRDCARIELGRDVCEEREAFFVRDNGVGFDMAYKDKLFGPFQRLHGSEFEGTGIGLATVKRIVERHGGCVWAQGVVDQGATVYFTLGEAD